MAFRNFIITDFKHDTHCYICGHEVALDKSWVTKPQWKLVGASIDHVVPVQKGGTNDPENLKTAHGFCNNLKGSLVFTAELQEQITKAFKFRFVRNGQVRWVALGRTQRELKKAQEELATLKRRLEAAEAVCESVDRGSIRQSIYTWEALEAWRKEREK